MRQKKEKKGAMMITHGRADKMAQGIRVNFGGVCVVVVKRNSLRPNKARNVPETSRHF